MRIVVDWDRCESHGQCEFAAPELFRIDDNGDLEVLDDSPPESMRDAVQQAVRRCPTLALRVAD